MKLVAARFVDDIKGTLVDRIGSLWPTVTMLIPHEYPTSFPLRLDSRLFSYKISGQSIALFEKFHIRQVNICFKSSDVVIRKYRVSHLLMDWFGLT